MVETLNLQIDLDQTEMKYIVIDLYLYIIYIMS